MNGRRWAVAVLLIGAAAMLLTPGASAGEEKTVLVFSLTKGFRHDDGIKVGNPLLQKAAEELGYKCIISEDPAMFDPDKIKQFACIIFNNTTGDLFPEKEPGGKERREAFMAHIKAGCGFIGIHAATDCLYDFPEYGKMINGYFDGHPWSQKVKAIIEDPQHPIMKPFGGTSWECQDEIYTFRNYDRTAARILMRLDNTSIDVSKGKRADKDYAMCWIRMFEKGRVMYQAFGHGGNVFKKPEYMESTKVAIRWACGDLEVDMTPSKPLPAQQ
jgi:type 1 glutamine amidotransferase